MPPEDEQLTVTSGRQLSRTPYRGPVRIRRSDGQREVWVEGQGYVPEQGARRLTGEEQSSVQAARDAALQAGRMIPQLNRFEELNRQQPTGNIIQSVGTMFGVPPLLNDPQEEEMSSITDFLTPRQREPGSGASSDRDVTMFRGALPNLGRTGTANSNIIAQARTRAQEQQSYAEYLEWYARQRGTINGAQEGWNRYINAGSRRLPWREHFGLEGKNNKQGAGQRRLRFNPQTGEIE